MYISISKNIQWNKKSNFWYQGRTQGGGDMGGTRPPPPKKTKKEKEKRKRKRKKGKLIKKIS